MSPIVLKYTLAYVLHRIEQCEDDRELEQLEKEFHHVERLLIEYDTKKEKGVHN